MQIHAFVFLQRVDVWKDVLSSAIRHEAVFILPEAQAGICGEGRGYKGGDGHWQT